MYVNFFKRPEKNDYNNFSIASLENSLKAATHKHSTKQML